MLINSTESSPRSALSLRENEESLRHDSNNTTEKMNHGATPVVLPTTANDGLNGRRGIISTGELGKASSAPPPRPTKVRVSTFAAAGTVSSSTPLTGLTNNTSMMTTTPIAPATNATTATSGIATTPCIVSGVNPVNNNVLAASSPKSTASSKSSCRLMNTNIKLPTQQQQSPRVVDQKQTLETITGHTMVGGGASALAVNRSQTLDPMEQEQILFEKRLCEDADGVAVKKINHNGKTCLRNIRCIPIDELNNLSSRSTRSSSSRSAKSANSWGRKGGIPIILKQREIPLAKDKRSKVLVWGKKKDVQIPLERFLAVRKGKTTVRSKKNTAFRSLVLSLITNDPERPSLDIEAPTKLDRDKFARAFARFLEVPLIEEDNVSSLTTESRKSTTDSKASSDKASYSSDRPVKVIGEMSKPPIEVKKTGAELLKDGNYPPPLPPANLPREGVENKIHGSHHSTQPISSVRDTSVVNGNSHSGPVVSITETSENKGEDDVASDVSSITGHGYDPEIVEELHQALNEMRVELEESRAEAARAVKVAEQAIQSAERSNSVEWQNTVTHKAAEAAAMAQKRSAEAMAKQRIAEERLEAERRTAAFWRKQAQLAEEEAGALQTRAASAEVQKASLEEQLDALRRAAIAKQDAMRKQIVAAAEERSKAFEAALERSRSLAIELELSKQKLSKVHGGTENISTNGAHDTGGSVAKKLADTTNASTSNSTHVVSSGVLEKVQAQANLMRIEFEHLKSATAEELERLPQDSQVWMGQVLEALKTTQAESERVRKRLAFEMTSRRKLLNEVQDLRGVVRIYCRPRMPQDSKNKTLMVPSQETIVLKRPKRKGHTAEMSFAFDRVFDHEATQEDVFTEIGDVCLGVLDGYNICVMAYGHKTSGKTHTIFGDVNYSRGPEYSVTVKNHGVHLLAARQLFAISQHRRQRYRDTFTLTILEVYNERLHDLLVGTKTAETRTTMIITDKARRKGQKVDDDASSGRQTKLEIRSDLHGETVVQGLISVEVSSFEDVYAVLCDAFQHRRRRLDELDLDFEQYEASSHVIATLKVVSTNVSTGLGCVGKVQFVDLASSDLVTRPHSSKSSPAKDGMPMPAGADGDWKFANKSIETLSEVVSARLEFNRSVPYRNSTLTHLLRDSLEHDTKVILLACITSDPDKVHETESTLRFSQSMNRVNIGKATKHMITAP